MNPKPVSDLDVAFPTNVSELMPSLDTIPEEFNSDSNPYCRLANQWFYKGLNVKLTPKVGIDYRTAIRHLQTV